MNLLVFIAGFLVLFGFIAHAFVGTKETLSTRHDFSDSNVEKNWYQSFLAWHLVTADLLLSASLLIIIALTDAFDAKRTIALIIGLHFFAWTIAGILILLFTGARKHFKHLFQWAFFLIVTVLLFFGMSRF